MASQQQDARFTARIFACDVSLRLCNMLEFALGLHTLPWKVDEKKATPLPKRTPRSRRVGDMTLEDGHKKLPLLQIVITPPSRTESGSVSKSRDVSTFVLQSLLNMYRTEIRSGAQLNEVIRIIYDLVVFLSAFLAAIKTRQQHVHSLIRTLMSERRQEQLSLKIAQHIHLRESISEPLSHMSRRSSPLADLIRNITLYKEYEQYSQIPIYVANCWVPCLQTIPKKNMEMSMNSDNVDEEQGVHPHEYETEDEEE
jgi:hypothetical protein